MKRLAVVLLFVAFVGMMLFASPKATFEKYGMKNAFPSGYSVSYSYEDDDLASCSYEFTKRNVTNAASDRLQFVNSIIKSVLASHPDATTYNDDYDTVPLKTLTKAPEEWQSIDINYMDDDFDVSIYISYYMDGKDLICCVSLDAYEAYRYSYEDIDWSSLYNSYGGYDYSSSYGDYSYGNDWGSYGSSSYGGGYGYEESSSHFDTTMLYEMLSSQTLAERQYLAESTGSILETRPDGSIIIRDKSSSYYAVFEKNGDITVYDEGEATTVSMYWPKNHKLAKLVKEPTGMKVMFTSYNDDVFVAYFDSPTMDQFRSYGDTVKKNFPLDTEFLDQELFGMYMYMFTGKNSNDIYCSYMMMDTTPILMISTEEI